MLFQKIGRKGFPQKFDDALDNLHFTPGGRTRAGRSLCDERLASRRLHRGVAVAHAPVFFVRLGHQPPHPMPVVTCAAVSRSVCAPKMHSTSSAVESV